MDASLFDENSPGVLFDDQGYNTFRPDELPPEINLEGELAAKLVEASRNVSRLSGIGHTVQNPRMLLQPFIRKEAVNSSQIEGTKATVSDLYVHEVGEDRILKDNSKYDVSEVANYVGATEEGITAIETEQISLDLVKRLHKTLMSGVRGREKILVTSVKSKLRSDRQTRVRLATYPLLSFLFPHS